MIDIGEWSICGGGRLERFYCIYYMYIYYMYMYYMCICMCILYVCIYIHIYIYIFLGRNKHMDQAGRVGGGFTGRCVLVRMHRVANKYILMMMMMMTMMMIMMIIIITTFPSASLSSYNTTDTSHIFIHTLYYNVSGYLRPCYELNLYEIPMEKTFH